MTKEEAKEILKYMKSNLNDSQMFARHDEALDLAIKALGSWDKYSTELWQAAYELGKKEGKNEKCEDCISRAEALRLIDEERQHLLRLNMDGAEHIIVHHARRIIEDMPAVTPQPKRGKWIEDKSGIYHCSNCNEEAYWDTDYGQQRFNYCPDCGSDNRTLESPGESFADGYEDGLEET